MAERKERTNAMTRTRKSAVPALLAVLLAAADGIGPAGADDASTADPEADAAHLVDEILNRREGDGGESLGEWSRGIVERALERAGETARRSVAGPSGPPASPLPAERQARSLAGNAGDRRSTAEVLVMLSLSVPAASWRQWAHHAARAGAPLVLRGVGDGGLPATAKRIANRLGDAETGVAIDPRLFLLFGVDRVPAVIVVPGGVPSCRSRGCADDPAPPHDRIAGNIGLLAALRAVADEGAVAREVARRHLERMEDVQ
ncbi:MAG: type-F conjugative transfer system pilin assembly protein TrbC [Boseongicola sp. SB0673_bin_14]|nr:type-F conjugative transfer system pilin assembly protein TrbC [Boseongicola sp. SB0673_bin_14]